MGVLVRLRPLASQLRSERHGMLLLASGRIKECESVFKALSSVLIICSLDDLFVAAENVPPCNGKSILWMQASGSASSAGPFNSCLIF